MNDQIPNQEFLSYFKTVVSIASAAITIIVAVAIAFSYNSISDIKTEIKGSLDSLDVKAIKGHEKYERALESYQKFSESTLMNAQEFAKKQIELIASEANDLAMETANNRIDEAFRRPYINALIESAGEDAIREFLKYKLDSMVNDANNVISNQIRVLPTLILSVDQIRQGHRQAFNSLDSLYINSPDSLIRLICKMILEGKRKDYQEFATNRLTRIDTFITRGIYPGELIDFEIDVEEYIKSYGDTLSFIINSLENIDLENENYAENELTIGFINYLKHNDPKVDSLLLNIAEKSNELNLASLIFEVLNRRGIKIDMFDFRNIPKILMTVNNKNKPH